MQFSLLTLAGLLAPVALADFQVYCGQGGTGLDGAGFATLCRFFDHAAISCDDSNGAVNHVSGADASGCGPALRCAGCNEGGANPRDWVITELEVNDDPKDCMIQRRYWDVAGSDVAPHFTIYRNGDSVSIIGVNGEDYGTCALPNPAQEVQCSDGLGNSGIVHNFDCKSPLSYHN